MSIPPTIAQASDDNSSNQDEARNNQIRDAAQNILRLSVNDFKSKVSQMFSSSTEFQSNKAIGEFIVAEINGYAVTQEKKDLFIKELINNLQNCKIASSEMSLSIIKNILSLEDHQLVKTLLEEKELSIEIRLENSENCNDMCNFLNKFNLQFVKLKVKTPDSYQNLMQCLIRILEKKKDKQIQNLTELNNQSYIETSNLKEKLVNMEKKIQNLTELNNQSQVETSNLKEKLVNMENKVEPMYSAFISGVETLVGIGSGLIKDEQLTSSGYWNNIDLYSPKHARLNTSTGFGGWRLAFDDMNKHYWIQVDLLQPTNVSGVVVQGRAKDDSYITKFKVQYGDSINLLSYVKDKSGNEVFTGNNDGKTAVRRLFQHPISGRFFRIVPVGYKGLPFLRFDLLSF